MIWPLVRRSPNSTIVPSTWPSTSALIVASSLANKVPTTAMVRSSCTTCTRATVTGTSGGPVFVALAGSPRWQPARNSPRATSGASVASGVEAAGSGRGRWLARNQFAEERIDHRDDEEREEGAAQHAANHDQAHRPPALAAGAEADRNGQDPGNGRKRRHENRPQPHPARLAHGFGGGCAGGAALVGEFHQEDAVLRDQADEQDEADE